MMVCLLLYAYCVGVFSSRKLALACERNLAFLAIVGSERPDFRTISDCRTLHLESFKEVFVQVWRLAAAAGVGEMRQRVDRWDDNPGQCVASQGHELWL
jgi:transposase